MTSAKNAVHIIKTANRNKSNMYNVLERPIDFDESGESSLEICEPNIRQLQNEIVLSKMAIHRSKTKR